MLGRPLAVPSTSRVRVPGRHPSHYAPQARVVLSSRRRSSPKRSARRSWGTGWASFFPPSLADAPVKAHTVVAVTGSMAVYAHGLYGFLRELDQKECDLIVASLPAEEGLGLAIANRRRRVRP
ncbi:Sua5 family C-terminal domain-containing protein [Streptomyces massasporeus]|uniref:Sua5 family C-terminal domain-containing protein n=1 Tax=Streptomyces massasporeus TaxID=67324 RepID=A0ABW6LNA9_9ACTN